VSRLERLRAPCQWGPGRRIALGAATFWPPAYFVFFVGFVIVSFFAQKAVDDEKPLEVAFGVIFVLHGLTILLGFALLGLYAFDVFRNPRLQSDHRILWVLLVALVGFLSMPVYWVLYLRPGLATADGPPASGG